MAAKGSIKIRKNLAIPTALTFSDAYNASGKDFLIATLLGDDTANRILAAGGWNFNLGWDGTMTLPIFGAVAIAGRFMGLNAEQMTNAFGISINMIGGALQSLFDYALTFKFGQGFSAKNGTLAAEMARVGWTGLEDALLGGKAYYFLYNGTEKIENPELLTKDLGKKFYMEENFKRYPCGIPNTPFAMAGMAIHEEAHLKASEIKKVELILSFMKGGLYYSEPFRVGNTPQVNAIFSYQYTAICSLLRGRLKVQDFSTESVCDPEILEVIGKSKIIRDPSIAKGQSSEWPGEVCLRVTTYNDSVFERTQSVAASMHKYPSREEILSKFWDQVEAYKGVSKVKAQKLIETIDHLEETENMKELTELLMP
jgi:2-methylcitrate dehydratase PrpD